MFSQNIYIFHFQQCVDFANLLFFHCKLYANTKWISTILSTQNANCCLYFQLFLHNFTCAKHDLLPSSKRHTYSGMQALGWAPVCVLHSVRISPAAIYISLGCYSLYSSTCWVVMFLTVCLLNCPVTWLRHNFMNKYIENGQQQPRVCTHTFFTAIYCFYFTRFM